MQLSVRHEEYIGEEKRHDATYHGAYEYLVCNLTLIFKNYKN